MDDARGWLWAELPKPLMHACVARGLNGRGYLTAAR